MASTWLGSGSGGWGFGRRVVDPEQALREAEAIAIAPDPWPEFSGPVVYEGSSEREVVPNLSEFSIEVHLESAHKQSAVALLVISGPILRGGLCIEEIFSERLLAIAGRHPSPCLSSTSFARRRRKVSG